MFNLSGYTLYSMLVRTIVLFTVIPVHECAHGFVADKMGDDTARQRGRLTLNPFAHLDLVGTVAMLFIGFGWAKPVPVDPRNFKNPRKGMAISALAGPVANVILAFIILIVYKALWGAGLFYTMRNADFAQALNTVLYNIIVLSLALAVFNLLPIPPLDGYKVFGAILPQQYYFTIMKYERYIFLALIVFLYTGLLSTPITTGASWLLQALDFLTRPIEWLF